jgi:hypothetical protein
MVAWFGQFGRSDHDSIFVNACNGASLCDGATRPNFYSVPLHGSICNATTNFAITIPPTPTNYPTAPPTPTLAPTAHPTELPTAKPTSKPSPHPTDKPTATPTNSPTSPQIPIVDVMLTLIVAIPTQGRTDSW